MAEFPSLSVKELALLAEVLVPEAARPSLPDEVDELLPLADLLSRAADSTLVEELRALLLQLRRRALLSLIPPKVLRSPEDPLRLVVEEEILDNLERRLELNRADSTTSGLLKLIRELAVDMTEPRQGIDHEVRVFLIERGAWCASCGYRFNRDDAGSSVRDLLPDGLPPAQVDVLKPSTWNSDLRRIRVEHRRPISSIGSNRRSNLTLLCELCNLGKGSYWAYVETRQAAGYTPTDAMGSLSMQGLQAPATLFFAVLDRDRHCAGCGRGPSDVELTLKPRNAFGLLLIDNLVATCYECDDYEQRWAPVADDVVDAVS